MFDIEAKLDDSNSMKIEKGYKVGSLYFSKSLGKVVRVTELSNRMRLALVKHHNESEEVYLSDLAKANNEQVKEYFTR